MTDEAIRSRPYSTAAACERCVFGRGEHAEWCEVVAAKPAVEMATCWEETIWADPVVLQGIREYFARQAELIMVAGTTRFVPVEQPKRKLPQIIQDDLVPWSEDRIFP